MFIIFITRVLFMGREIEEKKKKQQEKAAREGKRFVYQSSFTSSFWDVWFSPYNIWMNRVHGSATGFHRRPSG